MQRDQEEAVLNTKQAANTRNGRVCAANGRRSSDALIATNRALNLNLARSGCHSDGIRTLDAAAPDRRSVRAEVP